MRKNFGPKSWLFPLPVLIVAAYDENGVANCMNAAWGGIYDTGLVYLCLSDDHKTTKDILSTGAFTVSPGTASTVEACDYVGIVSGNKVPDKTARAGFTVSRASSVNAPVIDQLPICVECSLEKVNEDGIIIGKIENVSIDERILSSTGAVQMEELQAIAFGPFNNDYRLVVQKVADAFSCGKNLE